MNWDQILEIALRDWLPAVFQLVLGGVGAAFILPLIQRRFARSNRIEERRIVISEKIAQEFNLYVTNWRRLRTYSEAHLRSELDRPSEARLYEYAAARSQSRDELMSALVLARLYFDESLWRKISEFMEWDERHSQSSLADLPELAQWKSWKDEILGMMGNEN